MRGARLRIEADRPLGDTAVWGRVGYAGEAHAPPPGAYVGIDAARMAYTSVADSGPHPCAGRDLANLHPLVAAALYEAGFALEAGPLSTWRN